MAGSLAHVLVAIADEFPEEIGPIETTGRVLPRLNALKLTKTLDASGEGLAENHRVNPCGIDVPARIGVGFGGRVSHHVVV